MYSQDSWSLDDCVAYAVGNNLQLKDFKYNQDANKETYRQSVRNLLPNINAFSDYNIRYGRSVDPNNNNIVNTDFFSNNYRLNAEIDLFRGFQKINTIKASKFLHKASNEEVLHQKYLLAFRVMSAFYDIQFMEGLLTISKEQEEVSDTNYKLVKRQVELGQKAKADLYEAESALLADQLLVTQNENNVAAAKLKLIQEMNLEGVTTISIQSSLIEDDENVATLRTNKDSIYSNATTFVPIIKAQELKAKAAKKRLAIARGGLYPSLSFFAGYQTGYYETNVNDNTGEVISFKNQIKDNVSKYVGVSLSIPISNGWSNRSRVKQQKVEMMRADNNFDIQKQEMFKLIQQLVQEGDALRTEYRQSSQKMKAQVLTFEIAQKKYEKGLISAIELNQSKNVLANSQNENLQVQLRLKVNESTLDFYNGLPVFNINRAQ
ncbi:TolC family protein [Aquimarina sp. MAR_2010_214]|uniref:TolC family protein n=1 Tax=Aquimarina sp. MAR_2010_214 TaxID=1250026 RepID=UPI001E49BC29|nr:TolC family protein [Aquimarina sp. MAR_2010_214]